MLTKHAVIERFCRLSARVARERYQHTNAADCFCGQMEQERAFVVALLGTDDYQFEDEVMEFIETAVTAALGTKGTTMPFPIDKVFQYHAPKADQPERYVALREKARELAMLIDKSCPESREKSLAFTKLQECVMFANASIAINESE